MSLSCLGESEFYNQLKINDYIIFAPDCVSQNLILIKLCAELEKYSTVKDTLNLLKEDKVLYRISKKDSGGKFYYVYKCENEVTKGKNEDVVTSSQPM
jgi:Fe2+ or Zn2+ uptake regulation protein